MPKSRVAFWVLAGLALGTRGAAAEEPTSFFHSFKTFCADTGARGDAVKAAVLAAGGVPHDPPSKSTEAPFPMQTSLWDVRAGGQVLVVAAGTAQSGGAEGRAMEDCVISGAGADEASMAALARWAQVPASDATNERLVYYVFEDKDGVHQPPGDGKAAAAEGRIWRLTVIRAPGVTSVELMHLLAREK